MFTPNLDLLMDAAENVLVNTVIVLLVFPEILLLVRLL